MPRKRREAAWEFVPALPPVEEAGMLVNPVQKPEEPTPLERLGDAIIALAVRVDEMDRRLQQLFQPRERLLANGE